MEILEVEIVPKKGTDRDALPQKIIEKCIIIAREAHYGQKDRDGNPVILHPLLVGSMGKTDAEKCVGFLHDVIEDTDWTFEDLECEGLPKHIIDSLKLLTHEDGIDYYDYVQRIIDSGNRTAINVKINDLKHNIARGKAFGYRDLVRKHSKAYQMIAESLVKLPF